MTSDLSHDAFTRRRWQKVWTESSPEYEPEQNQQLRDSLSLITRFWPQPDGHFLEAGCGTAANALNLARLGVEVSGVDSSSEAVQLAESAFSERGLRGRFQIGDVRTLPFPDESFDFVYAGGVVEHFRDTQQAVSEMARVLRPGGRLLLTVPALTLSYPYLFLRGNVPAVGLVESAMSFLQFEVMRGQLATFGYERSFPRRRVGAFLWQAGLGRVEVGRFDTFLPLLAIPPSLRSLARRLARTDLFAAMYFGTGVRLSE